jgi:GlpG protein
MTGPTAGNEITLQPLVQLEEHNLALLFANYLATIGIAAKVVTEHQAKDNSEETATQAQGQESKRFVIYCAAEQFEQAKTEFNEFIKQPYATKYQQAAWQHGETVDVTAHELTLLASFKESFLAHAGIITLSVFILCWLVFLASTLGWARTMFSAMQFYPQFSLDAFLEQPLRLLGPAFFHFSWLHIVFNTMWWWQLGGSVEKTLGKGTLLNLLVLSAIVSNVGQYLVSGANFGGLSGVVYALVGFVWWFGYLAPERGLSLSKPLVGFLLFWLLLGFVDLLPVNVANTAHLLGLLSGCFLAVYVVKVLGKDKVID